MVVILYRLPRGAHLRASKTTLRTFLRVHYKILDPNSRLPTIFIYNSQQRGQKIITANETTEPGQSNLSLES